MEDGVVQSLRSRKVDVVIVPGGCTKYIQVPDVFWKKPFKAACSEKYDSWMGEVGIHSETPAGNLKSPPQRIIIQWIVQSRSRNHSHAAPSIYQPMDYKMRKLLVSEKVSLAEKEGNAEGSSVSFVGT